MRLSQHGIERADISATGTFIPLLISLAGTFGQPGFHVYNKSIF